MHWGWRIMLSAGLGCGVGPSAAMGSPDIWASKVMAIQVCALQAPQASPLIRSLSDGSSFRRGEVFQAEQVVWDGVSRNQRQVSNYWHPVDDGRRFSALVVDEWIWDAPSGISATRWSPWLPPTGQKLSEDYEFRRAKGQRSPIQPLPRDGDKTYVARFRLMDMNEYLRTLPLRSASGWVWRSDPIPPCLA